MENNNYTKANYSVAIEVSKPANDVFKHIIRDVSKFLKEKIKLP